MSAITLFLVVVVLVVCALYASDAYRHRQQAVRVLTASTTARLALAAKVALRNELGMSDALIRAPDMSDPADAADLVTLHARSLSALGAVANEMDRSGASKSAATMRATMARYQSLFYDTMAAARLPAPRPTDIIYGEWQAASALLAAEADARYLELARSTSDADPFVDEMMRIDRRAWLLRNDAGRDRGILQWSIARNRPPTADARQDLDQLTGSIDTQWLDMRADAQQHTLPPALMTAVANAQTVYFSDYRSARRRIYGELLRGEKPSITVRNWFALSNRGLESIADIGRTALDLTTTHAAAEAAAAQWRLYGAIALMLASLALAILAATYAMRLVVTPLRRITNTMKVIAAGNLDAKIPYRARRDEIGQFAQALAMFRDAATERERLKAELLENQSAKETAELSNRLKSEFLANMSHELRTPLNAIIGFSEIIATEILGPGSPRYREYAADIRGAGTHLLSLINDILDLSKVEAGKLDLHPEPLDLSVLLRECLQLMQDRAIQQGLHVSTSIAPLPCLLVDRLRVKQVLLNLLSNAIKFTPVGGTVSLEAECDGSGIVTVCVRDTGIGIAPDMIPLVFEPFRQADSRLARKFEGTGLGLSLVRTLIELHGGTVRIESALHKGTAAFISFPASRLVQDGVSPGRQRIAHL